MRNNHNIEQILILILHENVIILLVHVMCFGPVRAGCKKDKNASNNRCNDYE